MCERDKYHTRYDLIVLMIKSYPLSVYRQADPKKDKTGR